MKRRCSRLPLTIVASLAAIGLSIARGANDLAQIDFFEKQIRPILVEKCYECHSARAEKPEGGLLLDTREGIRKGGESGPAVVPKDAKSSLLVSALRHESHEMPPDERLPDAIIADFVKWIDAGAADPRDTPVDKQGQRATGTDVEVAKKRWPYVPVAEPDLPNVADRNWLDDKVDSLLMSRLERRGLRPAADASRQSLIRRVTLDLVGLPPNPDEIDAFAQDSTPDSTARLVDRLLASPHFGERWGRHWLDVARYADSSGGGRTTIFPNAWRYRDYVIDALNRDLPYDQFLSEQIAGDLLDTRDWREKARRISALGFLAVGQKNLDAQDKELLRMDVVDEQIDTIGQAILGLTLGCARCHDHKFDPIPTRDYYALAGILRSTKTLLPGNVSGFVELSLPVEPDARIAKEHFALERRRLEAEIKREREAMATLRSELFALGVVVDDQKAVVHGAWKTSTSVSRFVDKGYLHDDDSGKGEKSIRFEARLPQAGIYEVWLAYNHGPSRARDVPVEVCTQDKKTVVRVDQTKPPRIAELFEPIGRYSFDAQRAEVVVANNGTKGFVIADAVEFVQVGASDDHPLPDLSVADQLSSAVRRAESLDAQLKRLEKAKPADGPMAMGVLEEERIEDCPIFVRGNVHSAGEVVPRGFLSVASPPSDRRIATNQSGRLELAGWLASPENPLTARVMANRIWQHLFGRGIVPTPDNFGERGERPSHPELLDALAVDLVESGWSIKSLIRRIATSHAYRLSAEGEDGSSSSDPRIPLFGRQGRRRIDVEVLRDSMLVVAGSLDIEVGGPTIRAGTKTEVDYEFDDRRRSVYLPVFRAALFDMFEVFDFADPNIVVGARTRTVLPTQALYWMNSPFVAQQAESAARRLLKQPELDDDGRLDWAYKATLGRLPTAVERQRIKEALGKSPERDGVRSWAGVIQALFASVDFRYNS